MKRTKRLANVILRCGIIIAGQSAVAAIGATIALVAKGLAMTTAEKQPLQRKWPHDFRASRHEKPRWSRLVCTKCGYVEAVHVSLLAEGIGAFQPKFLCVMSTIKAKITPKWTAEDRV